MLRKGTAVPSGAKCCKAKQIRYFVIRFVFWEDYGVAVLKVRNKVWEGVNQRLVRWRDRSSISEQASLYTVLNVLEWERLDQRPHQPTHRL